MTDLAVTATWAAAHWFQLATVVGLFTITLGLLGLASTIRDVGFDLAEEVRNFAKAMCAEAPAEADQDRPHSFIDRLTGSIESLRGSGG